ncbi:HlyD family secretion protein [Lysobacter capsici]|uniref:HlyD family secretion protein n=1 Tax=Lysobacter capsici TaxID=435897 RepID=UPI00287BC943|nr:HlyD family secretion protein [Lysobacter capsici]WND79003.1 HlyD family secretion protein [Lysobacter capsici]WND84198.1 HlyD family secretion protein [Lysobacter capsici]
MNTAVNAAGGGAVNGEAKPRWRPSRKAVIAVAVAVALAIGGAAYILSPKRSVSTDNAYLQADSSIVAPKVRGLVAQVLVNHNQVVKRGDALLRIDAEEFDAKVASAGADLQDARAAVQAAQAALVSLDAEQRLAQSTVHAAQVSIRASDAQSEVAQANRRRYDNLVASGAVARQDVEQFRAAAITAQVGAQRSRAEFEVSRNQADVTRAKRSSLQAGLAQAQANVARAQAALNLALQDQRHTLIRAPIDGVVADRQIEQGDYVQPGTRVMSIVPLGALYVVANFKETQTARMMAGQRANIEVDALPGTTLHGRIDSFAPGSGSQFSLLPFEPGTGNFTKIVQRVPVRIRFDPGQPELARLRPGLSSTVSVRLDTPPTATLVSAVP